MELIDKLIREFQLYIYHVNSLISIEPNIRYVKLKEQRILESKLILKGLKLLKEKEMLNSGTDR